MSTKFLFYKFVDNAQQYFAFTPQANFPANNLNFPGNDWRWWDWIQAIFLKLFYFKNLTQHDESVNEMILEIVPPWSKRTVYELDNKAIRNFLVGLKLFFNAKSSLPLWSSKWQIGHKKWFLNTNLFLVKLFLITKFDCLAEISPCMTDIWFLLYGLDVKREAMLV